MNLVVDYFRWRNEDAHRNALEAHCYWALRRSGKSAKSATEELYKLSTSGKNELLYLQAGLNFNDVPNWQKCGIGFYWESYRKEGVNPVSKEVVFTTRRRIKTDLELLMKDNYSQFVRELVLREHYI